MAGGTGGCNLLMMRQDGHPGHLCKRRFVTVAGRQYGRQPVGELVGVCLRCRIVIRAYRMISNATDVSIADIEVELAELEELISLQRRRVDLLKTKNALIESKPSMSGIDSRESDSKTADKEDAAVKEEPRVCNPLINSEKERESKLELSPKGRDDVTEPTFIMRIFGGATGRSTIVRKTNEDNFIDSMTRLQRLTTDLANERNLLAWGRTALAASRTCLAFFALEGTSNFGRVSVKITSIGFIVMAFLMMTMGLDRYNKIKRAIMSPTPPLEFDRITNVPIPVAMILLFLLGIIATSSNEWVN